MQSKYYIYLLTIFILSLFIPTTNLTVLKLSLIFIMFFILSYLFQKFKLHIYIPFIAIDTSYSNIILWFLKCLIKLKTIKQ